MWKTGTPHATTNLDHNTVSKKRGAQSKNKRAHSSSPLSHRMQYDSKKSSDQPSHKPISSLSAPVTSHIRDENLQMNYEQNTEKEKSIPQCVLTKILRNLATKKREFIKLRRGLIQQQNTVLEHYAGVKEMESRAGVANTEPLGEVRVLSVSSWPAHDLLLLVRDDLQMSLSSEPKGVLGPQVLQQMDAQLTMIPEEMLALCATMMERRHNILTMWRNKFRNDHICQFTSSELKTRNMEFDQETEKLNQMVTGIAENLKAKVDYTLKLARIPWLDRETMVKKIERLQKENLILQNKVEQSCKNVQNSEGDIPIDTTSPNYQALVDELSKERAARESLKEVMVTADINLRVARTRISNLERQLKDSRAELDTAQRKHKELEQLCRQRESCFDARSRKLLELSKTGEMTIETLSRQRDALEMRVKELCEQVAIAKRAADANENEQRFRADSLQAKLAEQEKCKLAAEKRIKELESRMAETEEQIRSIREKSARLVEIEKQRCLEYVPTKEKEPTDEETEIWKELQITKEALLRAEEELRQSRADKDSFLNSLSRIAQEDGPNNFRDKVSIELLVREEKINKLQHHIDEYLQKEKLMKQTMTQYENELTSLRLEVKCLQNYDCYSKELPYQELQTELTDMHLRVEKLSREREALANVAASRALMLERHERAAELFSRMTRARRDLAASLAGQSEPPVIEETINTELPRSLSSMCTRAANTWTDLRAEQARVVTLESALLAQTLQLEREGRVRTQLERQRTELEREILQVP
ncbi:hypothetical protein ACJJTC_007766 [Scirpophaga incertulas]